jgi:hypothetical protein
VQDVAGRKCTRRETKGMGESLTGRAREMSEHPETEGTRKWKSFVLVAADYTAIAYTLYKE